ncbi:hypothetical protein BASA60_011130 [Batrachochytrium salamandrivorans]|nr:hypothetical protein BASA60_011130 [Batrachochytrium salamandrivorans]
MCVQIQSKRGYQFGGNSRRHIFKAQYVAQSDGKVVYTYTFQLRDDPLTRWVQVWCDTTTGEVVQAVNFANEASYKVIPLSHRDFTEGFSVTKFNSKEEPDTVANIAAAAVNLFYLTNIMHDISYQYGFTESAGNFQKDNFDLGGEGNDAVTINVLNPSYTNNANFITPPDGQPGVMNMFRFTDTKPSRNPGLDNAIVLHEYAHGIISRLTGGPATSGCISQAEAVGMGEGWSDVIAMIVLAKESDTATTEITIGAYITNNPKGLRFHPYTTDMAVNPWTYGGLRTRTTTYAIGEVWASMLWEVYWNLVTKHGFATNLYDASQSAGNVVAMRIIIGGMTIHSCNPTLLGARDAIIAADNSHYQGAHKCEIYKGFAKRGLGLGATDTRTDDFSVPSECQ